MIEKKIQDVVEELKNTPEFHALKQARSKLEKDTELKKRVEQFLEDNTRFLGQPGGGSDSRYNELGKRFAELSKTPVAAAFFEAGRSFETKVTQLYRLMNDLIENALEEN